MADADQVLAAGDLLVDGVVGVERVARLVDVGQLDRLAEGDAAGVGLLRPVSIRNSVVLPAPLGPMTPTMPARGRLKDRSSMSSRSP